MSKIILTVIIIFTCFSNLFSLDLIPYRKGNKWGFANIDRDVVVKAKYKEVGFFSGEYAPVKKRNKWAYINKEGKFVTNFIYESASSFFSGRATVTLKGERSYINNKFEKIKGLGGCGTGYYSLCPMIYYNDSIQKYGVSFFDTSDSNPKYLPPIWKEIVAIECVVAVKKELFWGFVNLAVHHKGDLIIDYTYDSVYIDRVNKNMFYVVKNKLYGFVNVKGKAIVEPRYYKIEQFHYGVVKVWLNNKFYFYVDRKGNEFYSMNIFQKRYHKKQKQF